MIQGRMHRRWFCAAGAASLAGLAVGGCAIGSEVVGPRTEAPVLHGTPFTVDIAVRHNPPEPALPTGRLIRGTPTAMRRLRVTVSSRRGGRSQTITYRV